MIISFIFLLTIFSNTVSADSSTIYVNGSSGNDSWDGQTWITAKLSIKNATGTVTNNGTVNIAKGTYMGTGNTNIAIDRNMTIKGQNQSNTIIDTQGTSNVFIIISGITVSIQNLKLTNGNSTNGGAIYNTGTLNVFNSTFTNNTANSDEGGAIYNTGTLNVFNSTFTGNTATNSHGGAIFNWGSCTIANCTFTGNTATNGHGGAIFNICDCTVSNCTFTSNTAISEGGAIQNFVTCAVTNCTFSYNTVPYDGGSAIRNFGTCTVTNCIFTHNNSFLGEGGAINNSGTCIVTNCTFTYNGARYGGAISGATCIVSNCTFTNNTAREVGGAIFTSNDFTVTNCTFTNNTTTNANSEGGAIYNMGTCTVHFNRFYNNSARFQGNAVYNTGSCDVNYNWWGSNDPNWSNLIYGANPARWVILTINATPNSINNTGNSTITADFNHLNSGEELTRGHIPDGIPVNFTTTSGTISSQSFTLNGIAQSTLKAVLTQGVVTVSAKVDNQTVNTSVTADTTLPSVTSVDPANNSNTLPNKVIKITFSEPIKAGNMYIELKNSTGSLVPITTSINGSVLTINHSALLTNGKHTLILHTGSITDVAGNQLVLWGSNFTTDTIAPTASATPIGGTYNNTQSVILKMSESGTIYYTFNGTTPSIVSTKYSGPITISSTKILKYLAIDLAGNKSPTYSQTYTIDKIAPTAKTSNNGGLYNTTKIVSLSMTEKGTIYYTLTGTTPTTASMKYAGPITISSTKTLKYLAVDLAGNKSPIYTQAYTIDKIPPKVSTTTPTNLKTGVSRTSTIIIKFSENIKASTHLNNITIKNLTTGKYVTITKSISGNTLYIKMTSTRIAYNWYQVTIPAKAIKDYADNNLLATYSFKFKTGA